MPMVLICTSVNFILTCSELLYILKLNTKAILKNNLDLTTLYFSSVCYANTTSNCFWPEDKDHAHLNNPRNLYFFLSRNLHMQLHYNLYNVNLFVNSQGFFSQLKEPPVVTSEINNAKVHKRDSLEASSIHINILR